MVVMEVSSIETILTIFITIGSISFGFFGVMVTLYCTFLKSMESEGIPPTAKFFRSICKLLFGFMIYNFIFVFFTLYVYCFEQSPSKAWLYILSAGIAGSVIFMEEVIRRIIRQL